MVACAPDRGELWRHADVARALGAPFVAAVLEAGERQLVRAPRTAALIRDWPGDPRRDAVAMRFNAALHALARHGRMPALSALYANRHDDFDGAIGAAMVEQDDVIALSMRDMPQTNEVGRSAAIAAALMVARRQFGLPFALLEIGSSCGLNLNLGYHEYDLGGVPAGVTGSSVKIAPAWSGGNLTLNLTGFHVQAQDSNINTANGSVIARDYKAKGLEFEGGLRKGLLSLTAGATYTDATIVTDRVTPAIEGNIPRHQASLIFQATPQISNDRFAVGAVFIGTTDSYAQDVNQLKMPGYVTTNAFVQVRPVDRVLVSLNATNLFDTIALTGIDEASIPASGILRGRLLNGRAISTTLHLDF